MSVNSPSHSDDTSGALQAATIAAHTALCEARESVAIAERYAQYDATNDPARNEYTGLSDSVRDARHDMHLAFAALACAHTASRFARIHSRRIL